MSKSYSHSNQVKGCTVKKKRNKGGEEELIWMENKSKTEKWNRMRIICTLTNTKLG